MERFRCAQSFGMYLIPTNLARHRTNSILLQNTKCRKVTNVKKSISSDISRQFSSFQHFEAGSCFLGCSEMLQNPTRNKYRKAKLTKRERIFEALNTPIHDVHGKEKNHNTGFDDKLSLDDNTSAMFEHFMATNTVTNKEVHLRDIVQEFIKARCDKEDIEWIFEGYPDLMRRHSAGEWIDLMQCLQKGGFVGSNILHIAAKNPLIFRVSRDAITQAALQLRRIFETETRMCRICLKQPHLLTLPPEHIENRFAELSATFAKKDLMALLNRNPSLFLDDINQTQMKLDYVMDALNVPEKQVLDSRLFTQSIQHIIKRSEFLMKSGLYVRPDKDGGSPVDNASLKEIVDTSDSVFCRKVAHCKLVEYEAFCSMFDRFDSRSQESESYVENAFDYDNAL